MINGENIKWLFSFTCHFQPELISHCQSKKYFSFLVFTPAAWLFFTRTLESFLTFSVHLWHFLIRERLCNVFEGYLRDTRIFLFLVSRKFKLRRDQISFLQKMCLKFRGIAWPFKLETQFPYPNLNFWGTFYTGNASPLQRETKSEKNLEVYFQRKFDFALFFKIYFF